MTFIRSKDNNDPPLRSYPKSRSVADQVMAEVATPPKCLNCGGPLKEHKDPIAKKFTGHLWQCPHCDPEGKVVLSIG